MTAPLIVSIPHKLGKDEALRRIKSGLDGARRQYASLVQINDERWDDNVLTFAITAMKQQASGKIDIEEDHVRVEVTLPWLLAKIASGAQEMIRQRTTLMLEKK